MNFGAAEFHTKQWIHFLHLTEVSNEEKSEMQKLFNQGS